MKTSKNFITMWLPETLENLDFIKKTKLRIKENSGNITKTKIIKEKCIIKKKEYTCIALIYTNGYYARDYTNYLNSIMGIQKWYFNDPKKNKIKKK